jgi:thiol-disulfide isomerase/thioredoxin
MDRRRWVISAAAAMCGWPALASAATRKPWPPRRATPALHLRAMDGQPWSPGALRGHPLLLNFWASWCEPCRSELPALEKFAQEQREAGLRVIAVNYRESESTVRRFLAAHPLALDVVRDADGAAARAFGVNIFPSTIVIDREGRTKFVAVGELEAAELPGLVAGLV